MVAEGIPGRIGRVRLKAKVRYMSEEQAIALLARAVNPGAYREECWLEEGISPDEATQWTIVMTEEQIKAETYAKALYGFWQTAGIAITEPA